MDTLSQHLLAALPASIPLLVGFRIWRRFQGAPRATTPQDKAARQWELLRVLDTLTGRSTRAQVSKLRLRHRLGWKAAELDDVCHRLHGAGLIQVQLVADDELAGRMVAWLLESDQVQLTSDGADILDATDDEPEPVVEPASLAVTVINGSTVGSVQQQVHSPSGRQQTVQDSPGNTTQDDLSRLYLQAFGAMLDQFPAKVRDVATASVATADAQLAALRPDRAVLGQALRTLRSIAEGMAGNAAFQALIELGRHLHL